MVMLRDFTTKSEFICVVQQQLPYDASQTDYSNRKNNIHISSS